MDVSAKRVHVINLLSGKTGSEAAKPEEVTKEVFWNLFIPILLRDTIDNLSDSDIRILHYLLCAQEEPRETLKGEARSNLMLKCRVSTALVSKAAKKFTAFKILTIDNNIHDVVFNPSMFGNLKKVIDRQSAFPVDDVMKFVIPVIIKSNE